MSLTTKDTENVIWGGVGAIWKDPTVGVVNAAAKRKEHSLTTNLSRQSLHGRFGIVSVRTLT